VDSKIKMRRRREGREIEGRGEMGRERRREGGEEKERERRRR
jgi:hypothetical protein